MINAEFYSLLGRSLTGPKITRSYSSGAGWVTTYEYEGTERAIMGFMPVLRASKRQFQMDLRTPKCTLIVTTPDSGDPQQPQDKHIRYELSANISQKSLYEHWRTILFATQNPAELIAIKAALIDLKNADPNAISLPNPSTGNAVQLSANGAEFYRRMLVGQDYFTFSQTVMKVTIIAGSNAELQAVYANSNVVYTTDQMLAEIGRVTPYAQAAEQAALNLSAWYETGGGIPSYCYPFPGWLKQVPSITPIAGDKDATTVEFWLEAWATYMYNFIADA